MHASRKPPSGASHLLRKKRLRNGESNPGHLRDRQRCYQLHHIGLEYLGFDPSTSCLLSTHASDCANTPATPGGFEPPRAEHTHLAGEPLNHSGKVSRARGTARPPVERHPCHAQNKKIYACRDSNSGFPACEAGVITGIDHSRTP